MPGGRAATIHPPGAGPGGASARPPAGHLARNPPAQVRRAPGKRSRALRALSHDTRLGAQTPGSGQKSLCGLLRGSAGASGRPRAGRRHGPRAGRALPATRGQAQHLRQLRDGVGRAGEQGTELHVAGDPIGEARGQDHVHAVQPQQVLVVRGERIRRHRPDDVAPDLLLVGRHVVGRLGRPCLAGTSGTTVGGGSADGSGIGKPR